MTLDDVIAALYASFCFEPGGHPDWNVQEELFAPGARLVRVNDDGVFEFTPETFRANLEGMIASGALSGFWESEVARQTHEFGGIAHVLSVYETRLIAAGEVINRGLKSMQLFERDGRWWISALLWRREGESLRIPPLMSADTKSP